MIGQPEEIVMVETAHGKSVCRERVSTVKLGPFLWVRYIVIAMMQWHFISDISNSISSPMSTLAARVVQYFVSNEDDDPIYDWNGNECDNGEMETSESGWARVWKRGSDVESESGGRDGKWSRTWWRDVGGKSALRPTVFDINLIWLLINENAWGRRKESLKWEIL